MPLSETLALVRDHPMFRWGLGRGLVYGMALGAVIGFILGIGFSHFLR